MLLLHILGKTFYIPSAVNIFLSDDWHYSNLVLFRRKVI